MKTQRFESSLIAIDCKLVRVCFRFSGIRHTAQRASVGSSVLQLTAIGQPTNGRLPLSRKFARFRRALSGYSVRHAKAGSLASWAIIK